MISMMLWPIAPMLVAAQMSTAAPLKCPVVAGIKAEAPPDQSADRFSGYWHMSADRLIWAPAAAPGSVQTFLGLYWVRPAGTHLTLTVRRLDVPGPHVTLRERAGYPTGFYWGGFDLPSDGCWEVTAAAGASELTFVADVRHSIQRFVQLPETRVTWSKEIGRMEEGPTRFIVTLVSLENPLTVTPRTRGIRVDLTDGVVTDEVWLEVHLQGSTRPRLEQWASGALPMFHNVGAVAKGDEYGLILSHRDHTYSFRGYDRSAELARLWLRMFDELNAPSQ